MLKAQRWLTRAVETINLHRPIIPAHQDVIHSVSNNVVRVNAENSCIIYLDRVLDRLN